MCEQSTPVLGSYSCVCVECEYVWCVCECVWCVCGVRVCHVYVCVWCMCVECVCVCVCVYVCVCMCVVYVCSVCVWSTSMKEYIRVLSADQM